MLTRVVAAIAALLLAAPLAAQTFPAERVSVAGTPLTTVLAGKAAKSGDALTAPVITGGSLSSTTTAPTAAAGTATTQLATTAFVNRRAGLTVYSADANGTFGSNAALATFVITGTAWTSNHNISLAATGFVAGDTVLISNQLGVLYSAMIKNLMNGGSTLAMLGPSRWGLFVFDGTNWSLIASGVVSAMP